MGIFRKRVTIFNQRDKIRWAAARQALEQAGIQGVRTGFYEENPVCGCGAKLDPRDFGPKGKIDRNTYYIRVYQEDEARARAVTEGL